MEKRNAEDPEYCFAQDNGSVQVVANKGHAV
jgi:hypothetical protein